MNSPTFDPAYRRVLLKLSGESFCRDREGGITMAEVASISQQIRLVAEAGVQLAIVCGGATFFAASNSLK